jgi:NitT/TauT family transport system permease protein
MRTVTKARIWRYCVVVVVLGAWELGVRYGQIDPFFFPLPSDIVTRVATWIITPSLWIDLGITLYEAGVGFVVGTILGIGLGLWLALQPLPSMVIEPFLKAFNAMPRIVLAPIFVLWFGLGILSKIVLVITLVFFLAFFNTYQGIRDVNPGILANARLLRAKPWSLMRHVYLPSATSWILSSLRVSIGFAVTGAVIGEYLGATSGIGHAIAQAEATFDAVGVFAGLVVLSVFVLLLDQVVNRLEGYLMVWRPVAQVQEAT